MRPWKSALAACLLAFLAGSPQAAEQDVFCYERAAQHYQQYGITADLLRNIAKVESKEDPKALNRNKNGTWDVGVMQINSLWRKTLGEEYWSYIYHDVCWNIHAGAYILATCIERHGMTWKAVGCYHSGNKNLASKYAWKVFWKAKEDSRMSQQRTPVSAR